MKKTNYWKEDEFVSYEEYASYGVSGAAYCRNLDRSLASGTPEENMCPLCAKELKEGSYKTMVVCVAENGVTNYYYNPAVRGRVIKVGNGCYNNLKKAYNKKYNK